MSDIHAARFGVGAVAFAIIWIGYFLLKELLVNPPARKAVLVFLGVMVACYALGVLVMYMFEFWNAND